MKKALLVLVKLKIDIYDIDYRYLEMKSLCESLDIDIVKYVYQSLEKPDTKFHVGSGKIKEILMESNNYDLIVFDDELSPIQLKNIKNLTDIDIADRTSIILDIFKNRASSAEANLQINLARLRYELPRIGLYTDFASREGASGGGLHSKGSGETLNEIKRRQIHNLISRYSKELLEIKKKKALASSKRAKNNIPIVALVGYTNAGKSSTMNKIIETTSGDIQKMVYAENQLFATLDTRIRQINYNKHQFILIDTIGFVSKLPSLLIESFRSTLEEIRNADLIINVIDFSSPYYNEQYNITMNMLAQIGALDKKMLLLLNKYDLLKDQNLIIEGIESMPYSNYTNLNVDSLLDYIYEETIPYMIELKLDIPYRDQKICHLIEEHATIYEKAYLKDCTYYHISIDKKYYKLLSLYEKDNIIN